MKLICLLLISFLFFNVQEETEWKKRKEKSGVVVYTRAIDGAPMDEFKGVITLSNTSITEILDVISDIKNYPSWIPDCTDAEILINKKKYHSTYYVAVKAPWPVTNRDAIYEMTTTVASNNTCARIDLKPRGDYIKEKKKFVRLYKGIGFWELEEVDRNKIKVTFQFLGDPGGKIPAWLANSFVVSNPYQTLINLKKTVRK